MGSAGECMGGMTNGWDYGPGGRKIPHKQACLVHLQFFLCELSTPLVLNVRAQAALREMQVRVCPPSIVLGRRSCHVPERGVCVHRMSLSPTGACS